MTASTPSIADAAGLANVTFTYQWLADDADIQDATGSTYALADGDEGKTVKVEVAFTDDSGNDDSLTSTATAAVKQPLTVSVSNVPDSHNSSASITSELCFSEAPVGDFSYKTLRDHAFTVTGGEVSGARRLERPGNIRWEVTVQPSGDGEVTTVLPVTTDCEADGAICAGDGRMLSNRLEVTVPGP